MNEEETACFRFDTSEKDVGNVREHFDYSRSVPPTAGLVADVRTSVPALETGGIVPISALRCIFQPGDPYRPPSCLLHYLADW